MGGVKTYPNLPPLHDLSLLKERVADRQFRFGSVVHQLRRYFPDLTTLECMARIRTLIAQVEPDSYAYRESWRDDRTGQTVVADVYGLADEDNGGFYVKFSVKDDCCNLHSCHPLEADLELRCGRTLRKPR